MFCWNVSMVLSIWQLQMWTYQWFAEILSDNILSWRWGCHQMSLDVNGLHLYGIFPALPTTQSRLIREWVPCLLSLRHIKRHISSMWLCVEDLMPNFKCSAPFFPFSATLSFSTWSSHSPPPHVSASHLHSHPSPHPHSLSLTLLS